MFRIIFSRVKHIVPDRPILMGIGVTLAIVNHYELARMVIIQEKKKPKTECCKKL
jgi:hypothetical protein